MPHKSASELTPPAALVARFRRDCEALVDPASNAARPLALAVSGGPDSMAMLALAQAAFPHAVTAATVDHGLRPEAAAEAEMVHAYCATVGIRHTVLRPPRPIAGGSIQAAARNARYALLLQWAQAEGACALATGHHLDDQAETFLMRAARGSGPQGLGGIRPRFTAEGGMIVVRPLLGWRRAELRALAEAMALPFVDDPSNADTRFDRTRARGALADLPWLDPRHLSAAADHAREADAALRMAAAWLWDARALEERDAACSLDMAGLPRELRRRLARAAIVRVRQKAGITQPDFDSYSANIEPLLDTLERAHAATHAGVLVRPEKDRWHFRPAPPRRSH